ncbi:MAG: type III secretion protein [Lachnospiraceae bacterium]|jgi:flagellar biosynthesis protein|nr:type III secretion protein [Lachnospiraceae bacterium]
MSKFNDVLNKKAVALSYDENKNAAPVVVASGMGYLAERMVELARESGVPIYEDNSLATMLAQLQLGSEIPAELYQAIVSIYVYFLDYVPGSKRKEKEPPEPQPSEAEALQPDPAPDASEPG